jgi:hypothetical protein
MDGWDVGRAVMDIAFFLSLLSSMGLKVILKIPTLHYDVL